MNARDELAEIIQDCGEYIPGSHADDYVSPNKAADAILAAGYRKPRTVTTAEELDALPVGSVILDSAGDAWQKTNYSDGMWVTYNFPAIFSRQVLSIRGTTATVLFEGEA